ncbi:MAG: hypothetical protein QOH59_2686 [Gemmatimonadales bacterium]|nr:hypothetical protein [Gemmatimonadales bacterium]
MKQASPCLRASWALALLLAACASPSTPTTPPGAALARAESLYADLRGIRDRIDVSLEAGGTGRNDGSPFAALVLHHNALRQDLATRLAGVDSTALRGDDARALGIMRRTLAQDLGAVSAPTGSLGAAAELEPACDYDPGAVVAVPNGLDSLRKRLYACYGWAQSHVVAEGDTLDRLSILGALGRTESAEVRRRLFLSLEPVWRSVNRDNQPGSPYRLLIAREVKERGKAESPAAEQARASGVPPDSLEHWLLRVLETWRDVGPDSLVEPWDWFYQTGTASRSLSRLVPLERLTALNREVYRSLGADLGALDVQYDLAPREGKTPVAYCTFGSHPRFINGRWRAAQPWVFATYRTGGLDNLNELLHETGHAVHIAAIRSRPAFGDWPDSDPFTEAVADFVALDVYEPAWQWRWLGDSVPLADGLRSRYGGVVLDVAWALFEVRMQRDPAADPNQVWTTLTRDYLHIRPHPELSWWAMRGQLVDSPGYMMNYAAGSILIAAIRARTREVHGPFLVGDPGWYSWVAPRLYRFGLERPTRQVIEGFLGGPVSPAALLADMRRMKGEQSSGADR